MKPIEALIIFLVTVAVISFSQHLARNQHEAHGHPCVDGEYKMEVCK